MHPEPMGDEIKMVVPCIILVDYRKIEPLLCVTSIVVILVANFMAS